MERQFWILQIWETQSTFHLQSATNIPHNCSAVWHVYLSSCELAHLFNISIFASWLQVFLIKHGSCFVVMRLVFQKWGVGSTPVFCNKTFVSPKFLWGGRKISGNRAEGRTFFVSTLLWWDLPWQRHESIKPTYVAPGKVQSKFRGPSCGKCTLLFFHFFKGIANLICIHISITPTVEPGTLRKSNYSATASV